MWIGAGVIINFVVVNLMIDEIRRGKDRSGSRRRTKSKGEYKGSMHRYQQMRFTA